MPQPLQLDHGPQILKILHEIFDFVQSIILKKINIKFRLCCGSIVVIVKEECGLHSQIGY